MLKIIFQNLKSQGETFKVEIKRKNTIHTGRTIFYLCRPLLHPNFFHHR